MPAFPVQMFQVCRNQPIERKIPAEYFELNEDFSPTNRNLLKVRCVVRQQLADATRRM